MARLRTVDVCDVAALEGDASPLHRFMELVSRHYSAAAAASGLVGPISRIDIALHWGEADDREILVLVYCDKPENFELITASVPQAVAMLSEHEQVLLLCDMVEAGIRRLAEARHWDATTVEGLSRSGRHAAAGPSARRQSAYDVTATGRGTSAPEQPHEIEFFDPGPMHKVPGRYVDEVNRLVEFMASNDAWIRWWTASPVKIMEISCLFDVNRAGPHVRVGRAVSANIWRPVSTMRVADPVELAREDVAALSRRLAERLDLDTPPSLPTN